MMKKDKTALGETQFTQASLNVTNQQQLQLFNSSLYPNRLICYTKTKISSINQEGVKTQKIKIKGSGCLISDEYVLTAAHNVFKAKQEIDKLKNIKQESIDESYIRQGLGLTNNSNNCICEFGISEYHINQLYNDQFSSKEVAANNTFNDFALLKVRPKQGNVMEQKYIPIVSLSESKINQIKEIFIYGYPIQLNKEMSKNSQKSSIYMNFQCGGSGEIKSYEQRRITYPVPTEVGISGAPIMAQYDNDYVIIGIHKGKMNDKIEENVGIGSGQMIEYLNELGYKMEKKPFVFTEKTLSLRGKEKEIANRQILLLMDRGLESADILVYTAFDLTNIKRITLSGNEIGNDGVKFLLRRKYPNIQSLFLTQNKITDLSNVNEIPTENWKNIQTLTTLGLNINDLTILPKGLLQLKKLEKLWLTHNSINEFPTILTEICKENDRESMSIYIYQNNINLKTYTKDIEALSKYRARVIWEKEPQHK